MLPGRTPKPPDLLAMARRRVWLIVIPPLVTFFCALVYSSTQPNLYQSDMLIAIDPQRVPDEFVRSTVTLETDRRMNALQVKVLSRTTLQQVIDEFDLYPEERQRLTMDEVITEMREDITVALENIRGRGGLNQPAAFHIRFLYDDPKIAALVTQRLGALFVNQNIEDRSAVAGATNRFLETQLEESRTKLEAQEQLLEDFRQRHGHELPTQTQANVQSLSSAQLQAQSLVESLARDRDRKQMLERLHNEAAIEPPAAPAVRRAGRQRTTARLLGAGPAGLRPGQPGGARAALQARSPGRDPGETTGRRAPGEGRRRDPHRGGGWRRHAAPGAGRRRCERTGPAGASTGDGRRDREPRPPDRLQGSRGASGARRDHRVPAPPGGGAAARVGLGQADPRLRHAAARLSRAADQEHCRSSGSQPRRPGHRRTIPDRRSGAGSRAPACARCASATTRWAWRWVC